jgi:hypothetical protein
VAANGKVQGKGKAWFTKEYTKKLIQPKFLRPIAKIAGYKQIKSSWELEGTMRTAHLDLGITDSLLWKLAVKKKVPAEFRRIAQGDAPLWSTDPSPNRNVAKR